MEQRRTATCLVIVAVAIGYYAILAAKQWTWMFVSGDSGDWLASSTIWMTPQPFGSPLYVLLGQFLNLFPGDLVIKMTLILSVLPAAITVAVVYLIVRARGHGQKLALLGSGILLACGIFLSQATVLEEYTLASMFVTLAFYFHMKGNNKLVALCLGLGTATHIIVAALALTWLAVNWKEWKPELKTMFGIFVLVGFVPYSLILALMAMDTPRLIAGGLSLESINAYLGTTGTIGKISLIETPERLGQAVSVLLLSFGVSLVPLVKGFTRPLSKINKMIIVTLGFCLWLYITNTDETTWTFLCFGLPLAAVAIISGLSRLPKWTLWATLACTVALLVANGIMLNADRLTKQNPEAVEYYQSVEALPDDSTVVLPKGGPYGLGIMYVMANGKELTPIFLQHEKGWDNQGYKDYVAWTASKKGIEGKNWVEQIDYCIRQGIKTYVAYDIQAPEWQEQIDTMYVLEEHDTYFERIVSYK